MTFLDEEGQSHQFTWRTIQTWYYRYKNHGITAMNNSPRRDKGTVRKVTPEEVLEALNAALPHFNNKKYNKTSLYRFCIENGLLRADQIARTTFCRFIREYDLLKSDVRHNKRRLAFSMRYANNSGRPILCLVPISKTTPPNEAYRLHRRRQPSVVPR